jgi:hypothetical protein
VQNGEKYTFLITCHQMKYGSPERKIIAREMGTGELRKAQFVKKGVKISGSDPKAWAKLVGKPADALVDGLNIIVKRRLSLLALVRPTCSRMRSPACRRAQSRRTQHSGRSGNGSGCGALQRCMTARACRRCSIGRRGRTEPCN